MASDAERAELGNLAELSAEIGADSALTQGAGGNTSLKRDGVLHVKASGLWLRDALTRNVFVDVALTEVQTKMLAGREDFTPVSGGVTGMHPSIETSMHARLAQRVVIHVHSVHAIAWAVEREGERALEQVLAGLSWAWVPYARPGVPLTREIERVLMRRPQANVLILANHGLVVSADTVAEARALLWEVEARLRSRAQKTVPSMRLDLLHDLLPSNGHLPRDERVHTLASALIAEDAVLAGVLYPDHAVFLGREIPRVTHVSRESLAHRLSSGAECVAVEGVGMILRNGCSQGAEAMLECLALVAPLLGPAHTLRFLTESEIDALIGWDAEKLRQSLSMAGPRDVSP